MDDAKASSLELWTQIKKDAEKADSSVGKPRNLILDQQFFAGWCRAYGVRWRDVQRAGVPESVQKRLRDGEQQTVAPETLAALRSALAALQLPHPMITAALAELQDWSIQPQERALLICYRAWINRLASGLANDPAARDVPAFPGNSLRFLSPGELLSERLLDSVRLERHLDELPIPEPKGFAIGGDDGMQRAGQIAADEFAQGPLLDWWAHSGFVARHWTELSAPDLYRYMTSGPDTQYRLLMADVSPFDRVRLALTNRGPTPVPFDASAVQPVPSAWDSDFDTAFDAG